MDGLNINIPETQKINIDDLTVDGLNPNRMEADFSR